MSEINMTIPSNIRTPDTYVDINLNAQRSGLPANIHQILFITNDEQKQDDESENPSKLMPINIYDKAQAEEHFSSNTPFQHSEASKMITAAIKTFRSVDVQCLGKSQEPA